MNINYNSPTADVVEALQAGIESGIIYNSDYTLIKDILSRRFEVQSQRLKDLILNSSPFVGNQRAWAQGSEAIYYALPYGFYDASKLFKGKLDLNEIDYSISFEVKALITFWSPVWVALYKTAKPLIVKTRKPNPNAKPEDARTLENTGTCPVCGKNFKRNGDGTLVRHGYKVEGREFNGACFGEGFQPFEVSPEGARKYLLALERGITQTKALLADWIANPPASIYSPEFHKRVEQGDPRYNPLLQRQTRRHESNIRQLESDARYFTQKLEGWTEATLPGILAGFDK